ncbi:hypothetical protein C0J52_08934 [Blattella germanica]|nr:hypothetical protein C0J52_08934 [Blattella germanica]
MVLQEGISHVGTTGWTGVNIVDKNSNSKDPHLLKVRGHQRAPSGSREFKELTKKDAQIQLQHDLDKLLGTVPDARQSSVKKELDGFASLFGRFLQEEANVPLVLMNSFNTDEDTQKIIRKYKGLQIELYTFNQSCFPRINRESLLPIAKNCNVEGDMEAWYPPGHGDFYESFRNSGLLRKFIDAGREYCFISNIDNLGATVDLNILSLLLNPADGQSPEFVMEVTDKTRADVKTSRMSSINVPRSRFLPVKKTSDLLLVMSNLYSLKNGSLLMSPQRMFPTTPLVKLGDNHFSKVKEFLSRFANIPDLIELDHLTVSGDVTFGRGVSLKGTVIIIANHGDRIDIPSGAMLENKIVSGNMRILDH